MKAARTPGTPPAPLRRPLGRLYWVWSGMVYVVVAFLLAIAAYMGWGYWQAHTTGDTLPTPVPVTTSTDTPSEQQPPSTTAAPKTYTVAPNTPRALRIPSIGVDSFVQHVGIDQYGQIAVPTNIHFTGWYTKSALPGEPGVTIIDGHLGGRYTKAVFAELARLDSGDTVQVQKGDLSWVNYVVTQRRAIQPTDSASLYAQYTSEQHELHLITCYGTYLPDQKTYDQRVVVVAVLQK